MRLFAFVRRLPSALRLAVRRFPSPYTLLERLLEFRDRYQVAEERRRARLELIPLEVRIVPDGRPLPFPVIYTGAGLGHAPALKAFDAETGRLNFEREEVYEPGFKGGVRVAAADFTGDGFPDVATAPGPGGGPRIRVFDGKTGEQVPGPLGSFWAYDPDFIGGVHIAAADVDGDKVPDIVVGAGLGGGPHVRVFSGKTGESIADFFAFAPDFFGGITVAAADLTGDGMAEVAIGAGIGGGPRVSVYDPRTQKPIEGPLGSFLAFDPAGRGGVFVGAESLAGDVTGDGTPDLIVGTGPGVAPRIKVFDGKTGAVVRDLTPFGPEADGGVRVAAAYVDDDSVADVIAGSGPGVSATVRVFSGKTGQQLPAPQGEYQPFGPQAVGGVFIAASNDPPAVITLGDETLSVGEGGSWGVWLYRSGGVTASSLDVTLSASGGDATWEADYTLSAGSSGSFEDGKGTVTFAANQTALFITIGAESDNLVEGDEQFTLSIDPGGYQVGWDTGSGGSGGSGGEEWNGAYTLVTIVDNPAIVWLDPETQTLAEGGAAGGVSVQRTGGKTSESLTAWLNFGASDDPLADWNVDYLMTGPTSGNSSVNLSSTGATITFASGETEVFLKVAGVLDNTEEGIHGFRVTVLADQETPPTNYKAGFIESGSGGSGGTMWGQTADVRIADAPVIQGEAFVAATGEEYDGEVARVVGKLWPVASLEAWVDWGDGSSSSGTLAQDGDSIKVTGQHTYAREGMYALNVQITGIDTLSVSPSNYAVGLGYVLATTDHKEMQVVSNVQVGGSLALNENITGTEGTYTATVSATSVEYSLTEFVEEPSSTYTLTRTGSFGFTLRETDTPLTAIDSSLTLSASESSTRDSETVIAADRYGTATGGGSLWFTLSQTGAGSGYDWTQSSMGSSLWRTETGTAIDGTYTASENRHLTGAASGVYSGSVESYSRTWYGTETTTQSEDGNHGPIDYNWTRTATGTSVTGTETDGFFTDTFSRQEWHAGSYHLTGTQTFTGGSLTEEGDGNFTRYESGNGAEPSGTVGFGVSDTYTYGGTSTHALVGVVTTSSVSRTGSSGSGSSGSLGSGTFYLSAGVGSDSTTTDITNNQGVLATGTTTATANSGHGVTGTIGFGTYSRSGSSESSATSYGIQTNQGVPGTWNQAGDSTVTFSQSGDRLTGSYSLHQTSSSNGDGGGGLTAQATVTGGNGTTGTRTLGNTSSGGGGGGATVDRTGNLISGEYSLHQTSSFGSGNSPGSSSNTNSSGTGGTATGSASSGNGAYSSGSSTLNQTGNAISGGYSFTETSSWAGTVYNSASGNSTATHADGGISNGTGGGFTERNESGSSTASGTGNEVSGTYSLSGTSSYNATAYHSSSGNGTATAAGGATDGGTATATATSYESGSSNFTHSGNSVNQSYSLHETSLGTVTTYESGNGNGGGALVDGSTNNHNNSGGGTHYSTASHTTDRSGNNVTTSYSLFQSDTYSGTIIASGGGGGGASLANASTQSNSGSGTATGYETSSSTVTATGTEILGTYSLHQTSSSTATTYSSDTIGGSLGLPTGQTQGGNGGGSGTVIQTSSATVDREGNSVIGDYSLHETTGSTVTAYQTSDSGSSLTAADSGTNNGNGTVTSTAYSTLTTSHDASGSALTGTYSIVESHTNTGTTIEVSNGGGSATGADTGTNGGTGTATVTTYNYDTATSTHTGNELSGNYSLHETTGHSVSILESSNSDGSVDAANGGTLDAGSNVTSTHYSSGTSTYDELGDDIIGTYSLLDIDTSTVTFYGVSTGGSTSTAANSSTADGDATVTISSFQSDTSTYSEWEYNETGDYSVYESNTSTASLKQWDDGGSSHGLASGATGTADGDSDATSYAFSSFTSDVTGNEVSGLYLLFQSSTWTVTANGDGTNGTTFTLADGSTSDGGGDGTGSFVTSGTWTLDKFGDALFGSFSLTESSTGNSTVITSGNDSGTLGVTNGASSDSGSHGTATRYSNSTSNMTVTGNESNGNYSLHQTDTSTSTLIGDSSSDGGFTAASAGGTNTGTDEGTGTFYHTLTSTTDSSGSASGAYSLHETGTSNSTAIVEGESGSSLSAGDSTDDGNTATATAISSGSFTLDREGNATGTYSLHQTNTNSSTLIANSNGGGTLTGSGGQSGTNNGDGTSTSYVTNTSTIDHNGSAATGVYSLLETGTSNGTVFATSSAGGTYTGGDGTTNDGSGGSTATTYSSGSYTITNDGNSAIGGYTFNQSGSNSATTYRTGGGGASVNATGGWSDSSDWDGTATIIASGGSTSYNTGNSATGAYSVYQSDTSTATEFATGTVRGLDFTSTATATSVYTHDESGNSAVGTYTLTQTSSVDRTLGEERGTNGRGTYTASGNDHSESTTTVSGNRSIGTSTTTQEGSGSGTRYTTGSDYSQTLTSGYGTDATATANAFTGLAGSTATQTSNATTRETGSGTTNYTLTQTQQSTVTAIEQSNIYTGLYTLTRDGDSSSSLHAVGSETSGSYTLDKTETAYDDSTTRGNRFLGLYTLDGTFGSTSTAIESLTHGSYGSTFTEILTEDGTSSGLGNANTGDYSRHDWGDRTADFVQDGTNASGSYHVTEGSTGSFDRNEIGNSQTGGYSLRETSDTGYSFTEMVSGSETWTLSGNGTDTMTMTERGDRVTGDYTKDEIGTDLFTLTETGTLSGGGVSQTVTGTDNYSTSWEGNQHAGTYVRVTDGGGTWTRTGTNAGNGTNDYTLSLTGDEIAGHFSASATGTDRYGLIERFDDVSNMQPGSTTPGNVSLHSHGLPFRDPSKWTVAEVKAIIAVKNPLVYEWMNESKQIFGTDAHSTWHGIGVDPVNGGSLKWYAKDSYTSEEFADYIIKHATKYSSTLWSDANPAGDFAKWLQEKEQEAQAGGNRPEEVARRQMLTAARQSNQIGNAARVALEGVGVVGAVYSIPLGVSAAAVVIDISEGNVDLSDATQLALILMKGRKVLGKDDMILVKKGDTVTPVPQRIALKVLEKTVCFAAGTPVLTPDGSKPIEHIRPGDLVQSRAEGNSKSHCSARIVEEVFVRRAPVMCLRIGGISIRLTAEHPFWVEGRGWVAARELRVGDELVAHDGSNRRVETVYDTGEWDQVYNLSVADFHTYFIGSVEWGFSAWVHNACFANEAARIKAEQIVAKYGGKKVEPLKNAAGEVLHPGGYSFPSRRAAQQAAAEIAGDLGHDRAKIALITKGDYRGSKPYTWEKADPTTGRRAGSQSHHVIGKEMIDAKTGSTVAGYADHSLGHDFSDHIVGSHFNATNHRTGIGNIHLFYGNGDFIKAK